MTSDGCRGAVRATADWIRSFAFPDLLDRVEQSLLDHGEEPDIELIRQVASLAGWIAVEEGIEWLMDECGWYPQTAGSGQLEARERERGEPGR